MSARTLLNTLAAAIAITAVLAGCSGTDTGSGSPSSAPAEPGRAPTQVHWSDFSGVQVPTSRVDGPNETSVGGVPSGYSHTPQGAILTIEQAQARLSLTPDGAWPQVLNAVTAPGPGRDAFASTRVFASITSGSKATKAQQYVGYTFTTYTPERADAVVVTRDATGVSTATPTTAIWRGDDWKLLLPDPASNPPAPQMVQDGVARDVVAFAAPGN
ncbi:hypothetical protein [Williamsia sp.]|uniref:hypothetical protein n=1 Tax=Williamsia sp. TaxID=1872085 RepID=UPI001A288212|nr:hypothetical protein [Williamsia sp.]MBJ7287561.1 hypothetical protein [Williamsia sp.]